MIVVTSQLVTVADRVPTFDSGRFGKNRGFNPQLVNQLRLEAQFHHRPLLRRLFS